MVFANVTNIKGQTKLVNLSDYSVVLYGFDVQTDVARIIWILLDHLMYVCDPMCR